MFLLPDRAHVMMLAQAKLVKREKDKKTKVISAGTTQFLVL